MRTIQALANKRARKAITGLVILAASIDMINRLISGRDEDDELWYDKIPLHIKERYIVFLNPFVTPGIDPETGFLSSQSYSKIPMPYGYNALCSVPGQIMSEAIAHPMGLKSDYQVGDQVARLASALLGSFNPIGSSATPLQFISPTFLDPMVQISGNKNWVGNKIQPEQNPFDVPKPEYQMHWSNVSEPSKWLAKLLNDISGGTEVTPGKINLSPELLDHWFEFFTGGVGRFFSNTLNTSLDVVTGEPVELRRIPFVRQVMGEIDHSVDMDRYYELMDEITYAKKEWLAATTDRRKLELQKSHGHLLRMITAARLTDKRVSAINKRLRIMKEKGATKAELEQLEQLKHQTMMQFSERYSRVLEQSQSGD